MKIFRAKICKEPFNDKKNQIIGKAAIIEQSNIITKLKLSKAIMANYNTNNRYYLWLLRRNTGQIFKNDLK